jgi:hypothetical protein
VETAFNQAVATANRNNTLVVIDAPEDLHAFTSLRSFILGGGRALVQAYALAGEVSLARTLNVSVERRLTSPLTAKTCVRRRV